MKVVLVTGSRDWNNYTRLLDRLRVECDSAKQVLVIAGGARGADRQAEVAAFRLYEEGLPVSFREFPADWAAHGRAAGFVRNVEMVKFVAAHREGGAEVAVLAFKSDFGCGSSGGTEHCVRTAKAAGLSGVVIRR